MAYYMPTGNAMVTQNGVDMNPKSSVWETVRDGLAYRRQEPGNKIGYEALNMLNIYPLRD
jgi:hypothetical protein